MEWLDGNKIQIIPPKRPKKLTGTRFATILGLNPWSTPFEIWCEVTRTYQKPFEDRSTPSLVRPSSLSRPSI